MIDVRTRGGRFAFIARFVVIAAVTFTIVGSFLPRTVETYLPASFWVSVQEARITSYDPLTMVATYIWHRTARTDILVDTYITLIETNGFEHQSWHVKYKDVPLESGERIILFDGPQGLQDFPDLEQGTYTLEGVICFNSPHGIPKIVSFDFEDYVIEEAE